MQTSAITCSCLFVTEGAGSSQRRTSVEAEDSFWAALSTPLSRSRKVTRSRKRASLARLYNRPPDLPGGMSERPKERRCKRLGSAYAGSNPAPPITHRAPVEPAHLFADPGTFRAFGQGTFQGRRHEECRDSAGFARGNRRVDAVRHKRAGDRGRRNRGDGRDVWRRSDVRRGSVAG